MELMIEFNANNMEELEEEARLKATEISLAIVEGICNGLDEGADVVALGILSNLDMDITVKRGNYLEALTLNIHRVEEAEEYELCSRAVKWIEHLQTEQE
jgi:hypothetical protein